MSYQVLARKWRPHRFDELVGQEHVVQALTNGLDQDRLHHAFLFTGTRGVGKTTLARILAKCLNCESGMGSQPCGECAACTDIDAGRFVDMLEIDAASRTKVDDTRELLDSVQYTPTRGRYKVYIIDEVHMLSASSFNALLKTLEEPPPHVKFVLATTDPDKIPVTILSRCLQFNLRRLLPAQIQQQLDRIVEDEGIESDGAALSRLARCADGSMRDGLSLLDQAIAFGGGKVSSADVERMLGLVDHGIIAALISAVAEGRSNDLLEITGDLVARSRDLDTVLVDLAETLHRICLVQTVPGFRDEERSDWDSIQDLAERISVEDAQLFYQIAIKGRQELGIAPDPRTGLEMTLLRMLAFRPAGAGAGTPRDRSSESEGGGRQAASGAAGESRQPSVGSSAAAAAGQGPQMQAGTESEPGRGNVVPPQAIEAGGEVDEEWIALSQRLELAGPVRELARNLHLRRRSGGNWEFVIAHSLRHLGSPGCIERLGRAISEQVGHAVQIRLIDREDDDLKTAASLEEQQLRTKMTDAELAIEQDPTIRSLKQDMGATVITDSIQPLQ
ncbi:DNA polymerase III subunit gamma/tau [Elongatibacter sediminis]|uniref:DNA polymerase III subunit gamma/tau n=1 Tax=Elongatibacter sediminis TaxID=3119006 RepID=A0AAW9RFH4_9GAMM